MSGEAELLLGDLCFPEGPRWHDGRLYFSDFYTHEVIAVDMDGRRETIANVPGQPSGLGWGTDGSLLVVAMMGTELLRADNGDLSVVADLKPFVPFANDMVVDAQGRAYVGGLPEHEGLTFDELLPTAVVLVEPESGAPNGGARVVADQLDVPNGSVITPDGKTLIVAESHAFRLLSFDIEDDGSLSNKQVWAQFDKGVIPDGICLDEEGCIWIGVADPPDERAFWRVARGGETVQKVSSEGQVAVAPMLGGPDGTTLFMLESAARDQQSQKVPGNGRIRHVEVDVPRAGLP